MGPVVAAKPELLHFAYDRFKTKSIEARKLSQSSTDCNGTHWQLTLYPDYPNITLSNKGRYDVDVTVSIILRDAKGYVAHEQRRGIQHFKGGKSQSFLFLIEWSKIINREETILLNGEDLIIEVEIYRVVKSSYSFAKPNPFGQNILKLLNDEITADVLFDVQGNRQFWVHRLLLEANAPVLADFASQSDKHTPVPIHDASPTIFLQVLRYVYGGLLPTYEFIENHGIELLQAADRYSVVGLKLAVESRIVQSGCINVSNVVDFILFADQTMSALLREYALSYFLIRSKDIFKTMSKRKSKSGDMTFEMMEAILCSEEKQYESDDGDIRSLSVEQIRRRLLKRGVFDLDGSKKMLIARLREQKIIERGCSTI